MVQSRLWRTVSGADLEEALAAGRGLEDVEVERCSAVYLWRRRLVPPASALKTVDLFRQWLEETLRVPTASIEPCELSHCVHLHGLSVGGGDLSEAKQETLTEFLLNPERRDWLSRFLPSLAAFAPPLYVGETSDLHTRLSQHLNGRTGFATRLQPLGLNWGDLELSYCRLSKWTEPDRDTEVAKQRRTLLELITARLGIAAITKKPG